MTDSTADYVAVQEEITNQQDAHIDALLGSVVRTKDMGKAIGRELDDHNRLLDNLDTHVEKTGKKINKETKRVIVLTENVKGGFVVAPHACVPTSL